jgi:diketogulonate reductase-like aldo/keto reductase
MQAGVVTREDVFVTSKLWNTDHGGELSLTSAQQIL